MLARLVASACLPTIVSFVCSLWLACFACFLGLGYSIWLACLVACLLVCLLGCLLLLASAYFCLLLLALLAIVLASFSLLPVSLALAYFLACLPACLLACWQKQDEAEFKMNCAFRFACYPGLQATASAADPFNLDTRWLAGWLAGLGWAGLGWAGWAGFSWIFIDFDCFSWIWCHGCWAGIRLDLWPL